MATSTASTEYRVPLALEGFRAPQEPEPWVPEPYMKRSVRFLLEHAGAALFLDPGLRKTSIAASAFRLLHHEGVAERLLVVAPLRPCYLVWPAEFELWAHLRHLNVEVLHGPRKEEALRRKSTQVYVINPDGLPWLLSEGRWRHVKADTLFVDESTAFKSITTQRFRTLRPLLPRFARRWVGTGDPAAESLLDLHGQMYLVDLGRSLSPYVTHYQHRYFERTGYGGYSWTVRDAAAEKAIYKAIQPYALRLSAEDYLAMPELTPDPRYVELPRAARARYDKLEDELFLLLDHGRINAVNAGVLTGKLRQLAGGGVYLSPEVDPATGLPAGGEKRWELVHTAKVEAVRELVEELRGQPLLLNYEYGHELERLRAEFGKDVPVLGGGSLRKDAQLEQAWNAGRLPLLLGHVQSVGHGLNLQKGHAQHVGFFTTPYRQELWNQFVRRIRRSGNKAARVFLHTFLARDTVEEAAVGGLLRKRAGQERFFDGLRTYRERKRSEKARASRAQK